MAQIVITFGAAATKGQDGTAPVMGAYPRATNELASSGTSAATTSAAGKDDVAMIKNNSASAIWASVPAAAPVAVVGQGHFILPGEAYPIGGLKEGHKIAVIDDA